MIARLWYPQLDVYDAIRRMAMILSAWKAAPISPERLCIFDFYIANGPLLHQTTMPSDIRRAFNALDMVRPDKTFISYPSASVLFNKMLPVQMEALKTLVGKDLIDATAFGRGEVTPTEAGMRVFSDRLARLGNAEEQNILTFLLDQFSRIGAADISALRKATGLRMAAAT